MGLRFDRAPLEDLYGSFRRAQLCPAAQQDSTVSVVCSREGQASRRHRCFPRRHRRRRCRRRLITAPSPRSAPQAAHADQAGCARLHTDQPDGPGMAEPPHLERLRGAAAATAGAASADCVLRILPGAHGSAHVEGPAVVQEVSAECRWLVSEACCMWSPAALRPCVCSRTPLTILLPLTILPALPPQPCQAARPHRARPPPAAPGHDCWPQVQLGAPPGRR